MGAYGSPELPPPGFPQAPPPGWPASWPPPPAAPVGGWQRQASIPRRGMGRPVAFVVGILGTIVAGFIILMVVAFVMGIHQGLQQIQTQNNTLQRVCAQAAANPDDAAAMRNCLNPPSQ